MNKFDKVLYTAKAHTAGGREGGTSRTDDGRLNVRFTIPGTPGEGTNPEQLFAAGWSACFLSALKVVASKKRIALPPEVAIDAEVDLGLSHGAFGLGARMNITLPGLDPATAQALVAEAEQTCPYSLATRGNVDVAFQVFTPAAEAVAQ